MKRILETLADRQEVISWFGKSLDTALTLLQNMVLSGIRGTGKTVLLRKSEDVCGRFEKASDGEQRVLVLMAGLGPEIRISELREKAKIDRNYLNQILVRLTEKGLVYRIGRGKYRFTLPLFEKLL